LNALQKVTVMSLVGWLSNIKDSLSTCSVIKWALSYPNKSPR